jgi:hypothetical protein
MVCFIGSPFVSYSRVGDCAALIIGGDSLSPCADGRSTAPVQGNIEAIVA